MDYLGHIGCGGILVLSMVPFHPKNAKSELGFEAFGGLAKDFCLARAFPERYLWFGGAWVGAGGLQCS